METIDEKIEKSITKHLAEKTSYPFVQMDELKWLQYKRLDTRKELKQCQTRIKESYSCIVQKGASPTTKWGLLAMVFEKGASIMRGVQLGYRVGDAIRTLIGIRNLFKKKK